MRYLFAFLLLLLSQLSFAEDGGCTAPIWVGVPKDQCLANGLKWSDGAQGCYSEVPTQCPKPYDPECVEGYERVYDKENGDFAGCMTPCPAGYNRYYDNGQPQDSCIPPPCELGFEHDSADRCVPVTCPNPIYELITEPYNHCRTWCAPQEERSLSKYGDLQCHLKACPSGYQRDTNDILRLGFDDRLRFPGGYNVYQECYEIVEPEPEPEGCDASVIDAVYCLRDSVVSELNIFGDNTMSILQDIIFTLTGISLDLDNKNTGGPDNPDNPSNPDTNVDTSPLNAEAPHVELNSQQLQTNLFRSNPQCPADRKFDLWGVNYDFKYEPLCNALEKLSLLVMIIAFILSAYIIVRD